MRLGTGGGGVSRSAPRVVPRWRVQVAGSHGPRWDDQVEGDVDEAAAEAGE